MVIYEKTETSYVSPFIMCSANLIVILFVSSAIALISAQNISSRNFNSECGQVFTKKQFIIESPRYPSNYPLNYQCSYLVKGPTCPTYFNLQFLDFNLEDSLGCSKDRFEIDDKDALCGTRNDIKRYFSEKGTLIMRFVSDDEETGRGYRILVTRLPCESDDPQTTTEHVLKWHTTNTDVEYTTTTRPQVYNTRGTKCCPHSYGSKKFVLTSPNFPYSMSTPAECVYEIYRANRNICRLRINIQFFWLGRYSENCPEGFLEINGRYICGCKSNLKLITAFEGAPSKILRFVSRGLERSSYSGFVLEVIQEECPTKYIPEQKPEERETSEEQFRFHNDQIKRVAWPNESYKAMIEKLRLISENTEVILDEEDPQVENNRKVVRHVYFFAEPNFNQIPRDREETDYIDLSTVTTAVLRDAYDYNFCLDWNRRQLNFLSSQNLPICKINEGNIADQQCVELNSLRGYFKSPGYPYYYPANMNLCYRFKKQPGYCAIRVFFKDFNLESSSNCEKDYLLLANNQRYCGSQISNTISTLDLRNKASEDFNLVTDAFYCGKGFYGLYEQIACQDMPHPVNPTRRPPIPMVPCYRTIQDEMFSLEVHDYNGPTCSFIIKKSAQNVCSVNLYFKKFDLVCASESLLIDGRMYCGHLSGQSVRINVAEQSPVILYKKSSNYGVSGLRLRIRGVQTTEGCICMRTDNEVPAERLFKAKSTKTTDLQKQSKFLFKMNKEFKDICGVVTNTTEIKLPATFCDFLMKNENNVTRCLPLTENSLIIPLQPQKLELKIQNVEKTQEIEFEEIDCDSVLVY